MKPMKTGQFIIKVRDFSHEEWYKGVPESEEYRQKKARQLHCL